MGLKFEAWTLPTAATFEKKFDIPVVLSGATGVRELSGWTDASLPVPASWDRFDDLIAEDDASLVRVFDEDQIVDEFIAQRCPISTTRPSVRVVSGPGINGIVEKCGVYAFAEGVDDWIWGSEVNLLGNPFFSASLNTPREWEIEITATGGTYTLTDGTDTTDPIAFDAQAAAIEAALQDDLGLIIDCIVTGTSVSPYRRTITLVDPAVFVSLTLNTGSLTGGSGTLTRTEAGSLGYGPWEPAHALSVPASTANYDAFAISSAQAHSGGRSLLIDPGTIQVVSGRNPGVQQVVRVKPGQTYRAGIWKYPTSATDRFRLGLFSIGEELIDWTSSSGVTLTPDDWNELPLSDVVIPDGNTEAIFRTSVTNSGVYDPAQTWYDDAYLYEGLPAASVQAILDQLLTAAQARGTFGFLEIDAQTDEDSNGVALADISFAAWYGQDLGHVFNGLHALGYNWKIRPAAEATQITPAGTTTHVLKIYNIGTFPTDHTTSPGGPSILSGVAAAAEVVKRIPDVTAVRARGLGDLFVDDTNPTALANMGRWEKIVDAEDVTSKATLQFLIDAAFADEDLNQSAASATLTYSDPARPLVRFDAGDRVWWQIPGILAKEARPVKRVAWTYGTPTTYQVQGSKILSGDAGIAQAVDYLLRQFTRRRGSGRGGVDTASVVPGSSIPGARLHLVLDASQEIAVGGERIAWTAEDSRFKRLTFFPPTLPTTEATIPQAGYYGVLLKHFEWDTFAGGGTVQVIRTRDGVDDVMDEWSSTSGTRQASSALAAPIPCLPGDTISVLIDHGDASAQDLAGAEMSVYLIDREANETALLEPSIANVVHSAPDISDPLTLPAGRNAGDLIVLAVGYSHSSGDPTWAGYSTATGPVVAGGNSTVMYYRIATGDASDIPNLGGSGHTEVSVWAYVFTGNKTTSPLEDAASNFSGSSTIHALPDLTATSGRSIFVVMRTSDSTELWESWSYPNVVVEHVGAEVGGDTKVMTGYGFMAPAGDTGAGTVTVSAGSDCTVAAAIFGAI